MTTLLNSARLVKSAKPRRFGEGIARERRMPYTAADLEWAAYELNKDSADYTVLTATDWDRMAAESWEMDRLEAGLCL